MSFTGTLDKCKTCEKTVYFNDLLTVDNVIYHKTCFKCHHCKGTLQMSNYSSMDGIYYCKTHFEQLFKESGNFNKNFHSWTKEKNGQPKAPNKYSSIFCGTQDKCAACHKTLYPFEKISFEEESFHKTCFKCAVGGCHLTHSSYASLDGILYCRHHFGQLFMEKGNFKHILDAAKIKKLKNEQQHSENHESSSNSHNPTQDESHESASDTHVQTEDNGEGES